jgi:hypothetical protein
VSICVNKTSDRDEDDILSKRTVLCLIRSEPRYRECVLAQPEGEGLVIVLEWRRRRPKTSLGNRAPQISTPHPRPRPRPPKQRVVSFHHIDEEQSIQQRVANPVLLEKETYLVALFRNGSPKVQVRWPMTACQMCRTAKVKRDGQQECSRCGSLM